MPKVVGVKFRKSNRSYYFEAGTLRYVENCDVIVETSRGTEIGTLVAMPFDISEEEVVAPLKPVLRIATKKDLEQEQKLLKKREEALKIAEEKIGKSNLEMKLTDCEYTFDGNKLIIYFTAEGRVDFRDLVKELASVFHVRIELRQIGARDECKMLGGLGPCGRPCCCANHMPDYAHVSIKMAKNQNLSLNPTKISGLCGRLMCCLSYENDVYVEQNKKIPSVGSTVTTADNRTGTVVSTTPLKEMVKVKFVEGEKVDFKDVHASEIVSKTNGKKDKKKEKGNKTADDEAELKNLE